MNNVLLRGTPGKNTPRSRNQSPLSVTFSNNVEQTSHSTKVGIVCSWSFLVSVQIISYLVILMLRSVHDVYMY